MRMAMGLSGSYAVRMGMLMVFVMKVLMVMLHVLMLVQVAMVFGQMEPNPNAHHHASQCNSQGQWLAQQRNGQCGAKERGH